LPWSSADARFRCASIVGFVSNNEELCSFAAFKLLDILIIIDQSFSEDFPSLASVELFPYSSRQHRSQFFVGLFHRAFSNFYGMSFVKEIFKPKPKAPREIVSATLHLLEQLKTRMEGKVMDRTVEDIAKYLLSMKGIMFGDGENEPDAEHVQALGLEIESSNLIVPLLASISQLDFESRKDAVLLLSHMLRRHCPSTCNVLLANFDIVTDMIMRYDSKEAALNFGSALRECIRVPALAQRLLQTRAWSRLLQHVESCRFDVSTDSFLTLKELLTKHKTAVAEHLERNFDDFFSEYRNLLLSQNYVARRQLLRLLGELLGDRCNFKIMTRLIADVDLLKVSYNA
jgi:calcium binding protein 39